MVKSNKFDYTGRTSSGPKLGKSIASDLEKRADKKQREAVKSSSARLSFKLHASAIRASKKDDKDANKQDIHKLDLKVPSKALTDDGFALLADGLENSLSTCHDLALVDLNLSDNALTTRSLARLAPIISKSRFNLQTLDLSSNNFRVSTPDEAQEWETFLGAFRPCMTLRRLDLSNNPSLGSWAFEVLARVYTHEQPVDPLPAAGYQSFITLPDADLEHDIYHIDRDDDGSVRNGNAPDLPHCANGKTMADPWVLTYRCGLRSIPYLTLTNVGLTDTGALFLSYVLEQHYYPIQLVNEINATEATNPIRTYRQDANTKGIDWEHNTESLTKDGLHLLQCAEKLRLRTLLGDADSITGSYMSATSEFSDANVKRIPNLRRPSFRSVRSIDYSIYDKSDINSARKKIQRNTIVQAGCDSVELWRASLNAILQSRKILFLSSGLHPEQDLTANSSNGQNGNIVSPSKTDSSKSNKAQLPNEALARSLSSLSLSASLTNSDKRQPRLSYAGSLMKKSPTCSSELTDVTNHSTISATKHGVKVLKANETNEEGEEHTMSSREYGTNGNARELEIPIENGDTSQRYADFQNKRINKLRSSHGGKSDGYRDTAFRCQLPLPVCLRILAHAMDPRELGFLDEEKQKKAFAWGQRRETLSTEFEWRMKDESSQILMLLASAECVEY